MRPIITHAVIQHGFGVYGAGDSPEDAYADAALWLGPDSDDIYPGAEAIAARCAEARDPTARGYVIGELRLIARADDAEEFDGYLRSQGCYHLTADGWVYAGAEADDAELQP